MSMASERSVNVRRRVKISQDPTTGILGKISDKGKSQVKEHLIFTIYNMIPNLVIGVNETIAV